MAYNTKEIIRDKNGNPISQYYNETTDSYEPVKGGGGGNAVTLYNADGTENNELSLVPILDKLSQLTGTVIDEETRKNNEILREDNEVTRVSLYDDLLIQLTRIEQITEQVPQSILDELTVILGKLGGLESLTTTEKANLVGAINEVKQQSNENATFVNPHKIENTTQAILINRDISIMGTQTITTAPGRKIKGVIALGAIQGSIKSCDGFYGSRGIQNVRYTRGDGGAYITNGNYALGFSDISTTDRTLGKIQNVVDGSFEIEWSKTGAGATGSAVLQFLAIYHN